MSAIVSVKYDHTNNEKTVIYQGGTVVTFCNRWALNKFRVMRKFYNSHKPMYSVVFSILKSQDGSDSLIWFLVNSKSLYEDEGKLVRYIVEQSAPSDRVAYMNMGENGNVDYIQYDFDSKICGNDIVLVSSDMSRIPVSRLERFCELLNIKKITSVNGDTYEYKIQ